VFTVRNQGCVSDKPEIAVLDKPMPSTKPALSPLAGANGTPAWYAIGLPEFWPIVRLMVRP
jgi:hypothetical protein